MIIYNAKILPMDPDRSMPFSIDCGYAVIENGVIAEVCAGDPENISPDDINAGGHILMPGMIDAHTHMGIIGSGEGEEGDDVNEFTDPVTPHLRAMDGVNGMDPYFADALRTGVTAVVTGCGSTNPIGGDMILMKTAGRRVDDMLIKRAAIKFALGENPKGCYSDRDESPVTRMATAAAIREALKKAQRYMQDTENAEEDELPEFDAKSEALIPLLKGEISAHFHCHRIDDIFTAMRICREFSLPHLLIHCSEGHLAADILGNEHENAVMGPIICDRGKPELRNISLENAAKLYKNGVNVAICTDHPEVPIDYLPMSAAMCVKHGLPYEEGLRAVTSNPAAMLGMSGKIGSIVKGAAADMVIMSGDPLDIMTDALCVISDGRVVYKKEN